MHNLCRIRGKAGNMLKKTINGKTTTFTFDGANQLVSSTTDGVTTKYAYDAAGRLVKEGDKTYRYGYLDKVLSVTEGERKYTYDYHVDGQLARADYGNGGRAGCPPPTGIEDFLWDGLALIRRGDERFVNEPHVGGGNPVASSKGMTYFNDALGTTVGAKKDGKYSAAALTAFGETIENGSVRSTPTPSTYTSFYTGKPHVAGLGHIFLFRNYRASLAKWQTADPLGYPDGWNQLAYGNNSPHAGVDQFGAAWTSEDMYQYYLNGDGTALTLTQMGLKGLVWSTLCSDYESDWEAGGEWWRGIYLPYSEGRGNNPTGFMDRMKKQIDGLGRAKINNHSSGSAGFSYNFSNGYNFSPIVWALGGGTVYVTQSSYNISWHNGGDGYIYYTISGSYNLHYRDDFSEPTGIPYIEWGTPYAYYDSWLNKPIYLTGRIPE